MGFNIAFAKGDTWIERITVILHTNDPKLWEDYDKYTDQQKEILNNDAKDLELTILTKVFRMLKKEQ